MSKITLSGNASGTGTLTIAAPNTNTDQTLTLPDETGTLVSTAAAATQANQETATSTTTFVSPGRQQYHPSAAKAWVMYDGTGTAAILSSYNITSLTDNAPGSWTVVFDVDFSSANYGAALLASIYNDAAGKAILTGLRDTDNPAAGSITIQTLDPSVTSNPDCQRVGLVCFGDQ